jgi:succinate dehydrogenase/fumarate reductase flavoprotein subunit
MWAELLVEKDAPSLAGVLQFIADDRDRLARDVRIADPMDYALAMEHRNLLDVGEAITRAATMRTESRGSHYRSDFPARDDANWLTNIFITRNGDDLSLTKKWVAEDGGWTDQPGDVRILPWG